MINEIQFSKKFMDKFIGDTMKDISKRGFIKKIYYYITDSKERTQIKISDFLNKQLLNPDPELKIMAKRFQKAFKDTDDRIIEILKLVHAEIKYSYDKDNWGKVEYWATAIETWNKKRDDCDGINNLIWVIARLSGIHSLQLWSAIGSTKSGGHFWLLYFSTKKERWYSIDGTYYPSFQRMKTRPPFRFSDNKYKSIWAAFNDRYTYKSR